MALDKYKVCPNCGEHNAPNKVECRKCETDLTGIKVVDSASESKCDSNSTTQRDSAKVLVRVCDCGEQNPPQARKCRKCGEEISDIQPKEVLIEEKKCFSYELKAIDDSYAAILSDPVVIVGRESGLKEYLGNKVYVSRLHAKFTIVAEKVFVENLSATNKTYVNNEIIQDGAPVEIKNGDEIGLGGKVINNSRQNMAAYFVFSVKS